MLKKRLRRAGLGAAFGAKVRAANAARELRRNLILRLERRKVHFPPSMTLSGNANEVLEPVKLIQEICDGLHGETKLFIDISEIREMDAGALLLLCSAVKAAAKSRWVFGVQGNYPADASIHRLLLDAGFETLVGLPPTRWLDATAVLKIETDTVPRPQIPKRLMSFLLRHTEINQVDASMLYCAIQECLENIQLHAYNNLRAAHRWYAVGIYDRTTQEVTVAILDRGKGIPSTVKADPGRWTALADGLLRDDADLIHLAASGERTESGDPKHGKGLSTLLDFAKRHDDAQLEVLSGSGMVKCSAQTLQKSLLPTLVGTVVSLKVRTSDRR